MKLRFNNGAFGEHLAETQTFMFVGGGIQVGGGAGNKGKWNRNCRGFG